MISFLGVRYFAALLAATIAVIAMISPCLAGERSYAIVPKPVSITPLKGVFVVHEETVIMPGPYAQGLEQRLIALLEPATGFDLQVTNRHPMDGNSISVDRVPGIRGLGEEGYILAVTPAQIRITAVGREGILHAFQTLLQLLPPQIFSKNVVTGVEWTIPCVQIKDHPRFRWRGAMLDVSRHFFPKEFLITFIDLLALHKMNRFHLHLTEDQGWRMEIKKYPRLTEVGAWRAETVVGHMRQRPITFDGKRHGGFYTQDDLREIVAYARDRGIMIVPEIEMPGHAQAAIAAYPKLGNVKEPLPVRTVWGVNKNIFNANEATILFLQDVLCEVLDVFPGAFIHIGGDEVPKDQWRKSPEAQRRIEELGLKDEAELQSYFIRRMDAFLNEKGRRLIGWDEILEGGLAPNAAVMSWRGDKGGIEAARAGHDVVMAPTHSTYFDYYQSRDEREPLAIGGHLTLEQVYAFEPVPEELTTEEAKHILGTQGQLWTEYIATPAKAEYMGFPRLCALAEVAWSPREQTSKGDAPAAKRDFEEFRQRLKAHLERLDILDVYYRPLDRYTIAGRWSAGQTTETYATLEFEVSALISKSGIYQIGFHYTHGKHRLDIEWVELLEHGTCIARDEHPGITGYADSKNLYRLAIDEVHAGRRYTVKASVRSDGGTESNGEVRIERLED